MGLNNTITGWIFGIVPLVEACFCPIFAKLLPLLGIRFAYIAGMFLAASCNILFGFVNATPSHDGGTLFAILCCIILDVYFQSSKLVWNT